MPWIQTLATPNSDACYCKNKITGPIDQLFIALEISAIVGTTDENTQRVSSQGMGRANTLNISRMKLSYRQN